jgi:O-acetyl-ADP-ribose deacetylase (regulator of RNase III)
MPIMFVSGDLFDNEHNARALAQGCNCQGSMGAGIAMRRIGAGYGGLSWKKVRAIVESTFGDWSGTLIVYEQYEPGSAEKVGLTR